MKASTVGLLFMTFLGLILLSGCKKAEAPSTSNTEVKRDKLTAAEAKQLAIDTLGYFKTREQQFAENAVMNDDALHATFLYSKEFKSIFARWPTFLDKDVEAEKFGYCRHLTLSAQSYAEAMNQYAFKGGPEKLASGRRKDFLKDWKGCESELAAAR